MSSVRGDSDRRHRRRGGGALIGAAIAVVIVAAVILSLRHFTHEGLPVENGTLELKGLRAPVTVIRDRSGIPHIYAQNNLDLARALGYVEAQDRLFQMELRGRLAEGRLAEIFGPQLFDSDYMYRLFDPMGFARASLILYSPEDRARLDAFAAGVNAYIDRHRDDPPIAFRLLGIKPAHVTPLDLEAGSLSIAVLLDYNPIEEALYLDLARRMTPEQIAPLLPVYPGVVNEFPPAETTAAMHGTQISFSLVPDLTGPSHVGIAASNNWVVDGTMTASGKPMIENDPHLPQSVPSIWYEAVLVTPRGFSEGATVAGSPFIAIGTNGHVAWGVTSVMADVMDFSIEHLSQDRSHYEYEDKWYPLERRKVTIHVRGAPDIHRTILSTRHGPLVSDVIAAADNPLSEVPVRGEYALAMRFAGLTPAPAAAPYFAAADALNGAQLVAAFRNFAITPLNLVWADAQGNIGWHVIGAIPERTGFDGKYPTPGWTGSFEWHGMIPFDQLPHALNPPSHFIVTANNRTAAVPYNGSWAPPFRHDRIAQLLAGRRGLTLADFRKIELDRVSLEAVELRDRLLEAGDGGDFDLKWALDQVRGFDGKMSADSRPAAIIAATEVALLRRVFAPKLGPDFKSFVDLEDDGGYSAFDAILADPRSPLWPIAGEPATLRASLKDALALLSRRLGPNHAGWSWGALNTISFENPLGQGSGTEGRVLAWYFNRGPMAYAGGRQTVNNGWFNLASPFKTVQISSYRMLVDMAQPAKMLAMNHSGESGIPASPHYDDMIEPWRSGRFHLLDPARPPRPEAVLHLVP